MKVSHLNLTHREVPVRGEGVRAHPRRRFDQTDPQCHHHCALSLMNLVAQAGHSPQAGVDLSVAQ